MASRSDWQSFSLVVPRNPATEKNWTSSEIDNISIVVESEIDSINVKDFLAPTGDGADTDWLNYSDDSTAAYDDINLKTPGWFFLQWLAGFHAIVEDSSPTELPDGMYTKTANAAQSFTFGSTRTFSTISAIQLNFYLIRSDIPPLSLVECFFRPTAGSSNNEQVIQLRRSHFSADPLVNDLDVDGWYSFLGYSTENPYTEAAWTSSDISSGEFGIRFLSGNKIVVGAVNMTVFGTTPSNLIYLDSLQMDVVGADADEAADTGILGKARLWSTNHAHLRLTAPADIDDVTNSVAVTTPGTLPLDHAILYGQVYLVNGTDKTRRYPNSSDVFEELTNNGSNYITGRTVAAFADRILYGWVNDNGTVTPERVAYSKIYDGGDHDDDSAGDFDLLDTPGGVIKLATLSEDICAAYKSTGIYALRRTGNDAAPIIRDVIDHQTGCLALATVKTVVDTNGRPYQIFLGYNPSNGINVYYFDGTQVSPLWGIHTSLRDDANPQAISRAFAEVDPQEGHYNLFVSLDQNDEIPKHYFTYHLRGGQWTGPHDLAYRVSCAGLWTLDYGYEGTSIGVPGWRKYLILGGPDGLPRVMDHNATFDEDLPHGSGVSQEEEAAYEEGNYDDDESGMFSTPFTSEIVTGDYRLVEDQNPAFQATLKRVHLMYKDRGPANMSISVSTDGGNSYNTAMYHAIGGTDPDNWGQYLYEAFDVTHATGRRHRIKLNFEPSYISERLDLKELWLEYDPGPENP